MISMVFRNSTSDTTYNSKFFEKILKTAIKEIKKLSRFSVSVNLVGEKKIQELNRKYRHKDKPTDVLSFPLVVEKDMKKLLRYCATALHTVDLGDIFVCLSIAKNDAKRENITIKEKLAQLTVHGFLHLQGYEHDISRKSAEKMFLLEKKILNRVEF